MKKLFRIAALVAIYAAPANVFIHGAAAKTDPEMTREDITWQDNKNVCRVLHDDGSSVVFIAPGARENMSYSVIKTLGLTTDNPPDFLDFSRLCTSKDRHNLRARDYVPSDDAPPEPENAPPPGPSFNLHLQ